MIGAGTMGHGIAHVVAQAGVRVHLYDAMRGAAPAGVVKITRNLDRAVELGKLQPAERDAALGRIATFDELTPACRGVDGVIEAVPEHLELKREILRTKVAEAKLGKKTGEGFYHWSSDGTRL